MKLNLEPSLLQTPVAGPAPAAGRSSNSARGGDVQTSGDSVTMSGASSALHRFSTERAARVDTLAQAVANGSYSVSAGEIGKALVRHAGG